MCTFYQDLRSVKGFGLGSVPQVRIKTRVRFKFRIRIKINVRIRRSVRIKTLYYDQNQDLRS